MRQRKRTQSPSLHRSRFTRAEALEIAQKYDMEMDIAEAIRQGYSPDDALQDWDIYPYQDYSMGK